MAKRRATGKSPPKRVNVTASARNPQPKAEAKPTPPVRAQKAPPPPIQTDPAHEHTITLPSWAGPIFSTLSAISGSMNAAGRFGRRRAGALILAATALLFLYSDWLAHKISQPMVMSQCDSLTYVRAVAIGRGCADPEHCSEREVSHHQQTQLAFDFAGLDCFSREEPWSPHMALWGGAVWMHDQITPDEVDDGPPVIDPEKGDAEAVEMAEVENV